MLKDAGDAQAQACLSILSINRLALQTWRRTPSLPVTKSYVLIKYIFYEKRDYLGILNNKDNLN
jgi:hypothetical protein